MIIQYASKSQSQANLCSAISAKIISLLEAFAEFILSSENGQTTAYCCVILYCILCTDDCICKKAPMLELQALFARIVEPSCGPTRDALSAETIAVVKQHNTVLCVRLQFDYINATI